MTTNLFSPLIAEPPPDGKGETQRILTISNPIITDKLKASAHVLHINRLPYPTPVPNDLDSNIAAVKVETLRRELLIASLEADAAASECDVGDTSATAILGEHTNLLRARLGYQLNVLGARGLSNLIVDACDGGSGGDLSNVYNDISDLTIEVGGVDVVPRKWSLESASA